MPRWTLLITITIVALTTTILITLLTIRHEKALPEIPVKFYVFGSPYCIHCRNMKNFLENSYGRDKVVFLDVYGDARASAAMNKLNEKGLPRSVPLTFIVYNNTVTSIVLGENTDKEFIDKLLYVNKGYEIPLYEPGIDAFIQKRVVVLDQNYSHEDLIRFLAGESSELNITLIEKTLVTQSEGLNETSTSSNNLVYAIAPVVPQLIILSLLDSINPCTFALYSSFTLTCVTAKNRKIGPPVLFVILIYLGYLLFGLGLTYVAFFLGHYRIIFFVIALILGIVNVFSAGRFSTLSYKCVWCDKFKLSLKTFTNRYLLAVFLSFFSVIFLLPCTAGPLLIFTSIISGLTLFTRLFLLIIYNVVFVIPLVLILLLIIGLGKQKHVANWVERNTDVLEFVTGIFLILIAIIFLGLSM